MSDTNFCLLCGKTIGMWDKTCKYCGHKQFGENDEYFPDKKSMEEAARILAISTQIPQPRQKSKYRGLTVEEQFFAGIHPDDEMYRKTLELEILSKNYKKK